MPASAIQGFTPTQVSSGSTSKGFNDINGNDFIKIMIAQLQQQDPLDPSKSDQLLTQLSQIKSLESNQALTTNLQGLTLQQSIGAGGNLIGKTVQGIDADGNTLTGLVTSVRVQDKKVYLELDSGHELPLNNITDIAEARTPAAGSTTTGTTTGGSTSPQAAALAQALASAQ